MVTDVSKERSIFIFGVKQENIWLPRPEDEGTKPVRNIVNHLPVGATNISEDINVCEIRCDNLKSHNVISNRIMLQFSLLCAFEDPQEKDLILGTSVWEQLCLKWFSLCCLKTVYPRGVCSNQKYNIICPVTTLQLYLSVLQPATCFGQFSRHQAVTSTKGNIHIQLLLFFFYSCNSLMTVVAETWCWLYDR
jgi:hypothetical protein